MADHLDIRPLTEGDLRPILNWRNHPSIRRVMFNADEISFEMHCAWFDRSSQDPTRRLLIVEADNAPLGFVQFTGVEKGGVSDWGLYVRPDAPKGSGRRLGHTALEHAFSTLELHKVCGQAIAFNEASIRLHLRLGFQQEGMLRDQHQANHTYHSVLHFGMLRSEWPNAKAGLLP